MTKIKSILVFLILAFVVVFSVQNAAVIEIQFLFWEVEVRRALVIFMALALGFVIGWLVKGFSKLTS